MWAYPEIVQFFGYALLSRDRATDCKFGGYIYRINLSKSLLKIFEKKERGRIQGLSNFFGYPLLSDERIKLRTSNFVGTFRGSTRSEQQPMKNVGNSSGGRSQGVPKIFCALRGHLCDSTAFLCNRVVNIWNSLPNHVVSANTTNVFNNRLDKFWYDLEIIYDFNAQLEGTGSRSAVE